MANGSNMAQLKQKIAVLDHIHQLSHGICAAHTKTSLFCLFYWIFAFQGRCSNTRPNIGACNFRSLVKRIPSKFPVQPKWRTIVEFEHMLIFGGKGGNLRSRFIIILKRTWRTNRQQSLHLFYKICGEKQQLIVFHSARFVRAKNLPYFLPLSRFIFSFVPGTFAPDDLRFSASIFLFLLRPQVNRT